MVYVDWAARLAEVQTAISRVLVGQEYWIGDRRLRRPDLAELRAMEKEYSALANRQAGGGIRVSVVGPIDR